MRFYYGPWEWVDDPFPHWSPPVGFGGLDLRTIPQMSQRGGTPGMGLFFGDGEVADSSYDEIGDGSFHDVKPTQKFRDAFSRAGYTCGGDTLAGMIFDLFTNGSDPDGFEGPKPLMPGVDGRLALHLGGQLHFDDFKFGVHPHTGKVRDLIRRDFALQFAAAQRGEMKDAEHHRRILDATCEKYRVEDWKEFVPDALQKDVPGRLKHETTITESFNRADSTTIIGNDLTWAQLSGTWGTTGNKGYKSASNLTVQFARAESDLSSDDHYTQGVITAPTADNADGVACRFSASDVSCYVAENFGGNTELLKFVAGLQTNLGSGAFTWVSGTLVKSQADASTIKGFADGVEKVSVTDTAITGNTRAGLMFYVGTDASVDDLEAADLGGGGGANRRRRSLICGRAA